ncbi:recombination regulator RecX [Clostridium isatidis]|uniref:Regulatory protein RecX n=1 Tax=Clostridium isatidis TaxID=182773 RepID=A0A343JAN4_9CLOT|nr:recombination regulator RecX [Clostridium isatidis]ASW42592.1 recombination regulator RecX [Clostridium isatidis]
MNIITKIEEQKKNKDRVNIYIDDEYAFSLSKEVLIKEGIKLKEKVDIDRIKKAAKEDDYLKCKSAALKIIDRSYKTEKEIWGKLLKKDFDIETINRTISFLKEYNFLSDIDYAKMYIKDKSKSQGKNKIKYNLLKKGLNDTLIEQEISKINSEEEEETAYYLANKKYNILIKREKDNYKLSQKLYRFLVTRGYSYEIASKVIKKLLNQDDFY